MKTLHALLTLAILAGSSLFAAEPRVLVYTRNGPKPDGKPGFVHDNIANNVAAILKLGKENGFAADVSDKPEVFSDANLKQYRVVIFANANNEAFTTEEQKAAFQNFIHAGGGFVGIHSACGSERKWPWFWSLIGGTFARHAKFQPFTVQVVDKNHPATAHIGEPWKLEDEFYFLKQMPADLHVLLAGDLSTLLIDTGKPKDKTTWLLAWCHEFEGGRAFYTSIGHKKEFYNDPVFQKHILGGIQWAMGAAATSGTCAPSAPCAQ